MNYTGQREYIVNGCDSKLCGFCQPKEAHDWGILFVCNHPKRAYPKTLGLSYEEQFGKGHFPVDCPLAPRNEKFLKELRNHLKKRSESLEKNYPKGHDQRDGAQTRIAEINQTLLALDAMESLQWCNEND